MYLYHKANYKLTMLVIRCYSMIQVEECHLDSASKLYPVFLAQFRSMRLLFLECFCTLSNPLFWSLFLPTPLLYSHFILFFDITVKLLYFEGITEAQNSSFRFITFWMLFLIRLLTQLPHLQSSNKYICECQQTTITYRNILNFDFYSLV